MARRGRGDILADSRRTPAGVARAAMAIARSLAMYITIRRHADKAAVVPSLAPRVRDGLVPLLKQAQGFQGYCAFGSEDGHAV